VLTEDSIRTQPPIPTSPISASRRVPRRRSRTRLRFVIAGLTIVAAIGYMIYAALAGGSEYFVTTGELKAMGDKAVGQPMKVGGRVVEGSIQGGRGSGATAFSLTDGSQELRVSFQGVVPDTFGPGVDVILEGKLAADGSFQATNMMAKCASKYEPAAKTQ